MYNMVNIKMGEIAFETPLSPGMKRISVAA